MEQTATLVWGKQQMLAVSPDFLMYLQREFCKGKVTLV
ncbi:hypothetical protein LEP1GSC040_0128 [Leptospira santarosai str. 2000030832]|nr:hypothetical protein LEP1GSC040_0128 [Leptospira santarosai str. 2000030832]